MSFVRRYSNMPTTNTLSAIEGVVIVDQAPPTNFAGVSTGVVGMVGEFADMKYAVRVVDGGVSTYTQPVSITIGTDMESKVGGFDSTIGDFGNSDGNGFAAIVGKPWSQLVVAPINLASVEAVRVTRDLPLYTLQGPISPISAAVIPAGTEFRSGTSRVKVGTTVSFSADPALASGTDGVQAASASPTLGFTSAAADFIASKVHVGDALVVGLFGGATSGTYRVVEVTDAHTLKLETADGSVMSWVGATSLPWRIHPAASFDSGVGALSNVAACTLPARPLDVDIDPGDVLTPASPGTVSTSSFWNPISGLKLIAPQGITFIATIQSPNQTQSSSLRALYFNALKSLANDSAPTSDISIVFSARTSPEIAGYLRTHAIEASAVGKGRVAVVAPYLGTSTVDALSAAAATRDERVIFCWPAAKQYISQAVNTPIETGVGTLTTTDGILGARADMFMASILSNLASERNPGQAADPIPTCLSNVKGFEYNLNAGASTSFTMQDYIQFKAAGIAALRQDRTTGWQFQSGVTSSLILGQQNINRRRMADEIQDSLSSLYQNYVKLPLTSLLKARIDSETVAYLSGLQSANNPAAQRIEAFLVDSKSGNTPELNAQGIYVVIVKVRMLGIADTIVIQSEIGPTVNVTAA